MGRIRITVICLSLLLLATSIGAFVCHAVAKGEMHKRLDNNLIGWAVVYIVLLLIWTAALVYAVFTGVAFTSRWWATGLLGSIPIIASVIGLLFGQWVLLYNSGILIGDVPFRDHHSRATTAAFVLDLLAMLMLWILSPLLAWKLLKGYAKAKGNAAPAPAPAAPNRMP